MGETGGKTDHTGCSPGWRALPEDQSLDIRESVVLAMGTAVPRAMISTGRLAGWVWRVEVFAPPQEDMRADWTMLTGYTAGGASALPPLRAMFAECGGPLSPDRYLRGSNI